MSNTLLILGLPGAGKTTFLAAMWHVVRTGNVPGSLTLVRLPAAREYLNWIGRMWESCQEQEHTKAGTEITVSLQLEDPTSKKQIEVAFPDLSGEAFELQWSHRQWGRAYHDLAARASGAMVFVHPDQPYAAQTIADEVGLADVLAAPSPELASDLRNPAITPYDDAHAAAQAKLVDLLQFLTFGPLHHAFFPVCVVVSAWDKVSAAKTRASPAAWLRDHLPLLDQFLRANAEVFVPRIFGVSAIGGDLDAERARLLDEAEPWRRIRVVQADGNAPANEHDITLPVRHLLADATG